MAIAHNTRIHPSADVSQDAEVGDGTAIWNNAQVRAGAVVGRGCNLGKDVYIDEGAVVGNGVKIQNGVSIYHGVTVEDDAFLGPHCAFTNDLRPRAFGSWHITPTRVCRGASIGANATIVCGATIGSYAMVAAGSVVTHDVPDHGLVMGNPARLRGYVCRCGHKLMAAGRGEPDESIKLRCPKCGCTAAFEPGFGVSMAEEVTNG